MEQLKTGKINPRDYQIEAYDAITDHIRNYTGPAFVEASVGAGKTIMIGMVAKRCQDVGMHCTVLARQGDLIDQTSTEMWNMEVKNSIYSASLNSKSTTFSVVAGTEGTVNRALDKELKNYSTDMLLIDECHMVDWEDVLHEETKTQYGIIIKTLLRRNPKLRIIGLSGSPYRSSESIIGPFWKKRLVNFDTEYLIGRGFLKPIVFGFGHDDVQYDLSEWRSTGEQGAKEFTSSELTAMQRKILKEGTTTQKIMIEVQDLAAERGGVLITCAGKKHCEEAAKYLPDNSYGIVTDDLSTKKRKAVLDGARDGSIKYVLQVGCLTTGVNVPRWDCVVILRNIGSLTLLTQLIGRGLRTYFESTKLAKQFFATEPHENELRQDIIAASTTPDCLVLDYSSTMDNLGEMYQNPILEEAQLSKGKFKAELIECPSCSAQNSQYARRCIGDVVSKTAVFDRFPYFIETPYWEILNPVFNTERCEWFWQFIECRCGVKNDTAARFCRSCNSQLIDPNAKLTGKHYTDQDFKDVLKMSFSPTRCGNGVLIKYVLPDNEIATEVFWPFSDNKIARQLWKTKFVVKHINGFEFRSKILRCRTVGQILGLKAVFDVPTHITHRLNDKGRSIIGHRKFSSGREELEQAN